MKRVYYIIVFVGVLMLFQQVSAQNGTVPPTRQRRLPNQQQSGGTKTPGLTDLSVSAKSMNEQQTQQIGNAPWLREIYRRIDLKNDSNMPLYFPVEPIEDRMNLFTLMFKLFSENKLDVYEFIDGKEIFTDKYKLTFNKEFLDKYHIFYTEKKSGAATIYEVNDVDIPSSEVLSYLVKEAWYFNPANSTFDVKILSICPYLVRDGDFGEVYMIPLFWVPYENIRPYVAQQLIMTSNMNNALTYSMDDYFRKRMYKGEIVKTTNLMNYPLRQLVGDNPEALRHAQDSIESQLKFFEERLWVGADETSATEKKKDSKDKEETKATQQVKKPKTSKPKSSSSASAPSKSVRDRR